ncbi:hypothetical protein HispidOSU_005436 [Sigmodon hispidus]
MLRKHSHSFALVLGTLLVLSYCLSMASAAPLPDPNLDAEWEEWKMKYLKTYSPDEEGLRRAVWEKNKEFIDKHNENYRQGKTSFSLGLNHFSDMTREEFMKYCCGTQLSRKNLPKSENGKKKSYVTHRMD